MHATAPAVSLRVSGGRLWHCLQWVLPGLAAAVLGVWLAAALNPHASFSAWAVAAQALLPGLAAAGVWRRAIPRQDVSLVWDSRAWQLNGRACTPQVMLDLGPWMLLRCSWAAPLDQLGDPGQRQVLRPRAVWVAASRAEVVAQAGSEAGSKAGSPAAWHALRAALFARRKPAKSAPPTLPT